MVFLWLINGGVTNYLLGMTPLQVRDSSKTASRVGVVTGSHELRNFAREPPKTYWLVDL